MEKIKLAHELFRSKAISGDPVSFNEIVSHTGWAPSSVSTYLRKQWHTFVIEENKGTYRVNREFQDYPLDVFERINSQKFTINKDPFKPVLTRRTEELITKSRESALLAVQVYNNPMLGFRTPSFVVHMVIAFTAFFHAIFEQEGRDYFYANRDGAPSLVDGQPKLWDIRECIRNYWGKQSSPTRKNLELFVDLRDLVEHRYAPAFDPAISSECQALLLNYERLIIEEFSPYYSLGTSIAIPLQLSQMSNKARVDAMRELQRRDYTILKKYVEQYRASLDDEMYSSPEYTFRVFLVQVPANRKNSSDYTMEFVPYTEDSKSEIDSLERAVTLIKKKLVPVANQGLYKPSDVVKIIQQVEPRFRMHEHTKAWKYFGVRPQGASPEGCDVTYCQYDIVHSDYVYTDEWIERLKTIVSNNELYQQMLSGR